MQQNERVQLQNINQLKRAKKGHTNTYYLGKISLINVQGEAVPLL